MSFDGSFNSENSFDDNIDLEDIFLETTNNQTQTQTISTKISFSLFSLLDFSGRFSLEHIIPVDVLYLIIQTLYFSIIKTPCFEKKCLLKWWDKIKDISLDRYTFPEKHIHCNKIFKGNKCHDIVPILSGDKCFICKDIACMDCVDNNNEIMDDFFRRLLIMDEHYENEGGLLYIRSRQDIKDKYKNVIVSICIQCITNMLHLLGYDTIHYSGDTSFFNELLNVIIQGKFRYYKRSDMKKYIKKIGLVIMALRQNPNKIHSPKKLKIF